MAKRLIKLLGEPTQNEDRKAAEALTPGMLGAINGSGNAIKYATAGGFTTAMFVLEREEMGLGIDDDYAINDVVKMGVFPPGTRVLAIIASGQNITDGTYLEAGAVAGTLRAFAAGTRIAKSLEAVNNTAGPGTARIRVEVV